MNSRNKQRVAIVLNFVILFFGTLILNTSAVAQKPTTRKTAGVDISRNPTDVPPPVGTRAPTTVVVELTAREVTGQLDPASGATYHYWTFNGKVPGPMIRVRQGDEVEVRLHNDPSSRMVHSIDLHAAIGPGGGAALSQTMPGQTKTFTFQATTPGLFVYHCGTPMIADHIANGMYGLILVEPPGGLPRVDHEYYVMQGEIYTASGMGAAGLQAFSEAKLLDESPSYFIFNGAVGAVSREHPLQSKVGDTVRIFFGNAGPNETSSLHVVGEIFSHDYVFGSLTSPPLNGVQTAGVPPGDAAMLELTTAMPGQFNFMDHAMSRMAKGLVGTINVSGAQTAMLMYPDLGTGTVSDTNTVSGMTASDMKPMTGAIRDRDAAAEDKAADPPPRVNAAAASRMPSPARDDFGRRLTVLAGCLTLQPDGRVMLTAITPRKQYRVEGRPLLFDANNNHIVQVTGYLGSVVETENPGVPSFVVEDLVPVAQTCSVKFSMADVRRVVAHMQAAEQPTGLVIGMGDMSFLRPSLVISAGQEVTWKNTSATIHNVVADPGEAVIPGDISLPAGAQGFTSQLLRPGDTFKHRFSVPGVYKYVCTLHEGNGMKGVVIVNAANAEVVASGKTQ